MNGAAIYFTNLAPHEYICVVIPLNIMFTLLLASSDFLTPVLRYVLSVHQSKPLTPHNVAMTSYPVINIL